MVLGYRLAPSVGGAGLQNAGTVAMCGAGTGASTPLSTTTKTGGNSNTSLSGLTQQQINDIAAAVSANINAFNQTSGGAQPGTLNNPFANSPLRINLNLSGLGEQSTTPTSAATRGRVRFTDIPRNLAQVENFATMAGNEFKPGQIRDLIRAWDTTQPGAENTSDLGGLPSAAKSLGNALRGKMVSCPKIDRSQYYTERQLSQCLGCTPDALLRGELGGT